MADSKELVDSDSISSPEFIQELLPSAERTALLYHMSYLCLGGFPKLERLIRERALETQLLFGSSEAFLMKCVGTSDNLVSLLLPSLKVAVEKNKPKLALKFLEKAKKWIGDIITDVQDIVKRYDKHNSDITASTSDITTEKHETEKQQKQQTKEMETLQKIIDDLEKQLQKINTDIEGYEKKIELKNKELQTFINNATDNNATNNSATDNNTTDNNATDNNATDNNATDDNATDNNATDDTMEKTNSKMSGVALFSMIVPFVGNVIRYIYNLVTNTPQKSVIKALQSGLTDLTNSQNILKERQWDIQNKLMENQLKMAKIKIENGQVPSVTHLDEVQMCLSRIQQILVRLQKFWEKVGSLLDTLKERTFAGDVWIEDLDEMKEEFLKSIEAAKEGWTHFGISCTKAHKIFSVQSNEAYKFLETNPSSLSEKEWQKEYESVKDKLERIRPNAVSPAAIMQ